MPAPQKIIAIISPPYSGSTLLTYLLSTHPAITSLGEGQKFHSKVLRDPAGTLKPGAQICSCGQPFSTCPFWQGIKAQVLPKIPPRIGAINFTKFRFYQSTRLNRLAQRIILPFVMKGQTRFLPPPVRQRYRAVCAANQVFIKAVLAQGQASVYLDATKDTNNALYLNGCDCFEVFVIHLIRDGRAQAYSLLKRHANGEMARAAKRWQTLITEQTQLLAQSQVKSMQVHYETLCQAPAETLSSILQAVGLDASLSSLDFRAFENHIMGNFNTRFDGLDKIQDRQEWRQKLDATQLQTFEQVAGDLNYSLGYS